MTEKKIGIYMFTNNLKKNDLGEPLRYIGQSTNIESRYKDHKGRYGKNPIYEDFETLGFDNFIFQILIECGSEELDYYEKFYIKEYDTVWPNGYNLTGGGSGLPKDYTELTIEKMRLSNIGERNPMYGTNEDRIGEGNPMYNRRQSVEARKKIAERSRTEINPTARRVEDKSGRIWLCMTDLAIFLNIQSSHLCAMLNGKRKVYHYIKHLDLHYLDERPDNYEFIALEELEKLAIPKKIKKFKKPLSESSPCGKKVIDKDGNIYSSVKECARKLNFRSSANLNSFLLGVWNFPLELEHLELRFLKPEHNQRRLDRETKRNQFQSKELSINQYKPKIKKVDRDILIIDSDGNVYNSIKECSDHFEVRTDKLSKMLNGNIDFYKRLEQYNLKYLT